MIVSLAEICSFAVTLRRTQGGLGRQLAHFANLPTSTIIVFKHIND